MHSNIGENLAVNLDLSLVQAIDQAAVRQAVQTCGRIDTRDPQLTELTFALAAVTVRVLASLNNSLLGCLEQFGTRTIVALRFAEDFLMACFGGYATFNSCHFSISS
jgi:hypothetical protein